MIEILKAIISSLAAFSRETLAKRSFFFFRSIIFTLLMSAIGVRSSLVDRISRKMLESRTDK